MYVILWYKLSLALREIKRNNQARDRGINTYRLQVVDTFRHTKAPMRKRHTFIHTYS